MFPSRSGAAAIASALLLGVACLDVHARSFRVARIPNGAVANCANCHVDPAGGGTRTSFGAAVNTAIGGTSSDVPFWDATLAALDSDNDGVTNGGELLDPDGDGSADGSIGVTNPGNRPPAFTMPPMTAATMGLNYQYQATAIDPEANGFTFSKVTGPAWLAVTPAGFVSGIPPAGSAGGHLVTLRVRDFGTSTKGYSMSSTTRTYTLNVTSSYAGWQALNFTLPAEAALAAPLADPDRDGLVNLLEYTVRLPARAASPPAVYYSTITDPEGRLTMILNVRDDDPRLSVIMEADADPSFSAPVTIAPTITDPVPGDGYWEYTFVDAVSPLQAPARFVRVRVELLP